MQLGGEPQTTIHTVIRRWTCIL